MRRISSGLRDIPCGCLKIMAKHPVKFPDVNESLTVTVEISSLSKGKMLTGAETCYTRCSNFYYSWIIRNGFSSFILVYFGHLSGALLSPQCVFHSRFSHTFASVFYHVFSSLRCISQTDHCGRLWLYLSTRL